MNGDRACWKLQDSLDGRLLNVRWLRWRRSRWKPDM